MTDGCGDAKDVTPLPFSESASTVGASTGFSDVTCDVAADAPGLWYKYTPLTDGVLEATVDLPVLAYFNLGMSVYSGECTSLTCIEGTDYSPPDLGKSLSWTAKAGTTYYIRVSSLNSQQVGSFQIDIKVYKVIRPFLQFVAESLEVD